MLLILNMLSISRTMQDDLEMRLFLNHVLAMLEIISTDEMIFVVKIRCNDKINNNHFVSIFEYPQISLL